MKTINANNGWYLGLGDMVCYGWLAAGARAAGEDVQWFATGWRAEVLRLLGVAVSDNNEGSLLTEGGFEEAMQRGEKTNYLSHIAAELGISAPPLRPTPEIPHDARQWAEKNAHRVLLFPTTHGNSKAWPAAYWVELAWKLKAAGIDTCMMLIKPDERFKNVPLWMAGISHAQLFALSSLARLVISCDSGGAHVAGTLNIPTLALMGVTSSAIYSHLPSVHTLQGKSIGCGGCHYGPPFRPACAIACQELYRIFPEDVFHAAKSLLQVSEQPETKKKGGRK